MKSQSAYPRLLADIGGTNARFAWQADPAERASRTSTLPCSDHASLEAAVAAYLAQIGAPTPAACAIGIATVVCGDEIRMTNHHWSFSISALQRTLGVAHLVVVNDFTALALSIPGLHPEEVRQVGGGTAQANAPIALIGPGTGLGVSGLLPVGSTGLQVPMAGEGGHATVPVTTETEFRVVQAVAQRFGHVSLERVLSGSGLVNIYQGLRQVRGLSANGIQTGEQVTREAQAETDPLAREAVDMFCAFLGGAAGNLALSLGARGGVYIGGGIVPRLGTLFERSAFRERFQAKGRFTGYLASIPTFVIHAAESPALIGASRALDMQLAVPTSS
jgi:glucokinase